MFEKVRPNRKCYDCGARYAKRFVEIGYLFSINDNITYQGRAQILSKNFNNINHGLRTPNEGINQRIWANTADKICFGRT